MQSPGGMREYALLQQLKECGYFPFIKHRPALPMELFQAHFLLFHALYHLQQTHLQNRTGILRISTLSIRLYPYQPGEAALMTLDPVRDYYLELDNLDAMTESGVAELLENFWRDYVRPDNRAMALAELGLSDPVDETTIKQAYRRLAMAHHPDRGGDEWRLQAINAAYKSLRKSRR